MAAATKDAPIEIDFGTIDLSDIVSNSEKESLETSTEFERTVVNQAPGELAPSHQSAGLLELAVLPIPPVQQDSVGEKVAEDSAERTKVSELSSFTDDSEQTQQSFVDNGYTSQAQPDTSLALEPDSQKETVVKVDVAFAPAPAIPEFMLSVLSSETAAQSTQIAQSTQVADVSSLVVSELKASDETSVAIQPDKPAENIQLETKSPPDLQETVVIQEVTSASEKAEQSVAPGAEKIVPNEKQSVPHKHQTAEKGAVDRGAYSGTPEVASSSNKEKVKQFAMAAVLSASILSVATLYFENGDTEKTLPPNSMRVAAPVLAPPKLAAKAVKPSQGRQTLAAKAVPSKQGKEEPSEQKPSGSIQEMPQRDLSKSKNRFYFESLEKKILRGDAYGAISQFRTRLDGPLDADDKIVAAEMTGRYYLMVGSPQRAIESLEAICSAAPENHPMTCIHYFRALISAGKWALARSFFQKISEQPSYSPYKEQIEFSRMALLALSNHQPASVRDLFASYVSWRGSDLEWYRQRTHWLVSSLLELTRKERHDLLKSFLDLRRDSLLAFFKHSDVIGMTSADPIFIPFLNAQSALLETRSLGISGKRDLSGSVASTVATVFDLVELSMKESINVVSGITRAFVRWPVFSDVGKIVVANMNLNSGNIQLACNSFNDEAARVAAGRSKFAIDWALVGARCAAAAGNPDFAKAMLKDLNTYVGMYPSLKNDFHFWILVSKLQRVQKKPDSSATEAAKLLAVTEQDRGLLAAEEARVMLDTGNPKEAADYILKVIQKSPNHGVLLQAGSEILPRAGISPQKLIDYQSKIPIRYGYRDFEYPVISDFAMRQLLLEL